ELAEAKGWAVERARSDCLVGRLALQRGDQDRAAEALLECQRRLDAIPAGVEGVDTWRAEPARGLNVVETERGRFDEAIAWGKKAVAADEHGGTERNVGRSLQNLGIAYSYRGDFALAMEAFSRGLAIQERLGNQAFVGALLAEMAQIHYFQGRPEIAIDY